jgi:RHS repeat-associated protein
MVMGKNRYGKRSIYNFNGAGVLVNNSGEVNKDYVVDYTAYVPRKLTEVQDNSIAFKYVYGGRNKVSAHISSKVEKTKLQYHSDRLGSTTYLTDGKGNIQAMASYDEWGNRTRHETLNLTSHTLDLANNYTGHNFDNILGVYYAKARLYDAINRRFSAEDLIKGNIVDTVTLVAYGYVKNNPLKFIDPLGLYTFQEGQIAHITIQEYYKSIYGDALEVEVCIKNLFTTKSGRGRSDMLLDVGTNYEAYEIKSGAFKNEKYNWLGQLQLADYVQGLNKGDSKLTVQGTSLSPNKATLPFGLNSTKVLEVTTNFSTDPGMIYYEIKKKTRNRNAEEFEMCADTIAALEKLLATKKVNVGNTTYPVDTEEDKAYFDAVSEWLGQTSQTYLGLSDYGHMINIEYPDGNTKESYKPYDYIIIGRVHTQKELLAIYARNFMNSGGGANSTTNQYMPIVIPVPNPVPVPNLVPARVPVLRFGF